MRIILFLLAILFSFATEAQDLKSGGKLKPEQLVIDKKARFRMKGHPLRSNHRIPAEISQTKRIVQRQRINAYPVELPGIAEVDVLPYLQTAE